MVIFNAVSKRFQIPVLSGSYFRRATVLEKSTENLTSVLNGIFSVVFTEHFWMVSSGGSKGWGAPAPPTVLKFLDFMQFLGNLTKSYVGAPPGGSAPLLQGILDPPLVSFSLNASKIWINWHCFCRENIVAFSFFLEFISVMAI